MKWWLSLITLLMFLNQNSFGFVCDNVCKDDSYSFQKYKLPETFDEAVDYIIQSLSKEDRLYIKDFPEFDLIMFHHGWGTGIRNKILRGNDLLMKSCAEKAGVTSIYYDGASMLIINGVREKLNQELDVIDFTSIETSEYFYEIASTLEKAKNDKKFGYLASLPNWLYQMRRLNFRSNLDSDRNKQLLNEARKLVNEESSFSYLGVLYLVFNSQDKEEVFSILNTEIKSKGAYVELPSYYYTNVIIKNLLIQQDKDNNPPEKTIKYSWNKLTSEEFVVKCYSSLFNKHFNTIEEFKIWEQSKTTNYLMKWKYKKEITVADYQKLIEDPEKLLKILILTNRYASFDLHNHGVTKRASDKTSAENLVYYLGFKDKMLTDYPYYKSFKMGKKDRYSMTSLRYVNALSSIAVSLSIEELLELLSEEQIVEYNKNLKTDDLHEFKILGGFLFATQYDRIVNYPDKDKTFSLCYNYWENEFITWPMKYFLTDLLFQIDSNKALKICLKYFKEVPSEGSFNRNAILKSIIKYDFHDNKAFIENWFWTVYNKDFGYNPTEPDLILSLLNGNDLEKLVLYNQIIGDKRFKSELVPNPF